MHEKYLIPTLETALKVIKLLKEPSFSRNTLTGICGALEINKSTGLKILRTMQSADFLTYDLKTKRYELGPALLEIGSYLVSKMDFYALSKPIIIALAKEIGLTCATVVPTDKGLIVIDKVEGNLHNVRLTVSVGSRLPVSEGAAGKVYWSFINEVNREELYAKGLLTYNPNCPAITQTIIEIKTSGYAVSIDEVVPGTSAIASPMLDRDCVPVALLLAVGLTTDIKNEIEHYGLRVALAAKEISRGLGLT